MAFRVEIAPSALTDIEVAYLWMRDQAPARADAWYNGLLDAIFSLETFPTRCPLAPESEDLGREIRQLLYGKRGGTYRILFAILGENVVRVFRVRHSARDKLVPADFEADAP